jgi:hypothetical protein
MDLGIRLADHERQRSSPQPELLSLHEIKGRNVFYGEDLPKGKPSVIKEYCEATIRKHEDYLHLWVCIKGQRQL